MRFYTITLDATDTPKSLYTLIVTSLQDSSQAAELATFQKKFKDIARIIIYPESGNNSGVNGPARIGKGDGLTKVDRIAADAGATDDAAANGFPLLPGIINADLFPAVGVAGVYSTEELYISGETGDIFQLGIVTV